MDQLLLNMVILDLLKDIWSIQFLSVTTFSIKISELIFDLLLASSVQEFESIHILPGDSPS